MLYFITLPWAFFIGGTGLFSFSNGALPKPMCVIMVVVGFAPRFLQVRRRQGLQAKAEAAHAAMLASAGVASGTGYEHALQDTAIAINTKARTLSLRVGQKWKTYPFADVREWRTNKQTSGQVVAGNLTGAVAALGPSIRAGREADAATGLFVTVRDIDNPQWRIAMYDVATQARWMEILRQSINEG
jgi:hypothetical protein